MSSKLYIQNRGKIHGNLILTKPTVNVINFSWRSRRYIVKINTFYMYIYTQRRTPVHYIQNIKFKLSQTKSLEAS